MFANGVNDCIITYPNRHWVNIFIIDKQRFVRGHVAGCPTVNVPLVHIIYCQKAVHRGHKSLFYVDTFSLGRGGSVCGRFDYSSWFQVGKLFSALV